LRNRSIERLKLAKLYTEQKELKLAKHEFYLQGQTKESVAAGWKPPARGSILKADLPTYMDADPHIVEMTLRVAYQKEIVDAIETVLEAISSKRWEIKNVIQDYQLKMGG
jgi:hypothetical protein